MWKDVSYFDSFVKTPNFATFKEALGPYLTGPPDIQLYQSPGSGTASELMAHSSHLSIFKLNTDGSAAQLRRAEEAWSRFVQVLSDVAKDLDQALPYFHQASGLRQVAGIHLGVLGWETLSVSQGSQLIRSSNLMRELTMRLSIRARRLSPQMKE